MRKREREIRDKETIKALLERSLVGRIAMVNKKGFSVIKSVNFIYSNGKICVHSSTRGEKITNIRQKSHICFELDEPITYMAAQGSSCSTDYYYQSIIVKKKAELVNGRDKKLEILERLMEKYQPEGDRGGIPEGILKKTAVIEIVIEEMTGKEKLG